MRTFEIRQTLRTAVVAVAALASAGGAAMAGNYDSVVVFGDSLSDNGNLCAAAPAFCPPAPPYSLGRFSNGPVMVERLATSLGLPLLPGFAVPGGTNFAFGGARADNSVAPDPFAIPTLLDQAIYYGSLTGGFADPNALYVVFGGGNDVQAALEHPADAAAILANTFSGLEQLVIGLASAGATHILLADIPDVGLTPYAAALAVTLGDPTIPATATADAAGINAGLFALYQAGRSFGFDISYLDTFGLEQAAVADPAAYGLTNVTDPCFDAVALTVCANPDQYLFWDDFHPTAAGHQLLADAALSAIPEPASLALLGLGFALIGFGRRRASYTIA